MEKFPKEGSLKLEIGKYVEGAPKRYQEGTKFDINDSGANLFVYFNQPSDEEINAFKTGQIKYGYTVYKNVILLLFKIGNCEWIDAPYSIHLSKNLTELQQVEINEGLSLSILLVDASNGELKTLRLIGTSNNFTKNIYNDLEKQKNMTFEGYESNLAYIFKTYSTKELIKLSRVISKTNV